MRLLLLGMSIRSRHVPLLLLHELLLLFFFPFSLLCSFRFILRISSFLCVFPFWILWHSCLHKPPIHQFHLIPSHFFWPPPHFTPLLSSPLLSPTSLFPPSPSSPHTDEAPKGKSQRTIPETANGATFLPRRFVPCLNPWARVSRGHWPLRCAGGERKKLGKIRDICVATTIRIMAKTTRPENRGNDSNKATAGSFSLWLWYD